MNKIIASVNQSGGAPILQILHISDVHFRPGDEDQDVVTNSFLSHLKATGDDAPPKPDLVIFSGDLVQAGSDNAVFRAAFDRILTPLMRELGLGIDRIIVCPGNHDVNRSLVRSENYLEKGLLESLRTRDEINTFLDQHWKPTLRSNNVPAPVGRLSSFYQVVWRQLSSSALLANPFLLARKLDINGTRVGIAVFNTAWRCTGEPDNADRGNLILGERTVDHAIKVLDDCDLRLAILHHPLDWLRDEDRAAVEPRLHEGFDMMFFGHLHRSSPETRTNAFGGLIYSQAGALYYSRDYFNGYSRLTVGLEQQTVEVNLLKYDDRSRRFDLDTGLIPGGRLSFPLPKPNGNQNLRALLARMAPVIRKLGNDHLNLTSQDQQGMDIETDFVCPPLSESSATASFLSPKGTEPAEPIDLQTLLNDGKSIILSGPSESGKTTIAHALALKVARGSGDILRVPLIGNFREITQRRASLERLTRHYANEISGGQIGQAELRSLPLLVFVDNVDLSDDSRMTELSTLISSTSNARWILLSTNRENENLDASLKRYKLDGMCSITVNNLPRTMIRLLSARWMKQSADGENTNEMFQNVMEHIRRTGLPRTGYIVSLMLWTLKNTSSGELLNESVLLGNVLDYLLNRMDYRGSLRSEFDFQSKSIVLQHLAYWMKKSDDFQDKNLVVGELISYLDSKGLRYDASAIVEGFIKCGVFSQLDEQIGFRYKRFQEYFTAGHLRDNKDAFNDSISDQNWRWFKRELDIYTSRYRNETSLLDVAKGFIDASGRGKPTLVGPELESYMESGSNALVAMKRLEQMKSKPMTASQIDHLKDRAEARWKDRRERQLEASTPEQIARNDFPIAKFVDALELYSQFIRNLEFADREEKRRHLGVCVDGWVEMMAGIYSGLREIFVELRSESDTLASGKAEEADQIKKIIDDFESQARCLIPAAVSLVAHHSVGSEKLTELIDEIAADTQRDHFASLLAVSILLELDPARAVDRLESKAWKEMLSVRWVCEMLVARLYKYYLDRPMSADVNKRFVAFIAELEVTMSGNTKQKGQIMQNLVREGLQRRAMDPDSQ